jgi:hypothetical protein
MALPYLSEYLAPVLEGRLWSLRLRCDLNHIKLPTKSIKYWR